MRCGGGQWPPCRDHRPRQECLIPSPRESHRGLVGVAFHFKGDLCADAGGEADGEARGVHGARLAIDGGGDELVLGIAAGLDDDLASCCVAQEACAGEMCPANYGAPMSGAVKADFRDFTKM